MIIYLLTSILITKPFSTMCAKMTVTIVTIVTASTRCHGDWYLSSLDAHVAQHQLGACLVVEIRGDVETLGLSEHITGDFLRSTVRQLVGSGRELKFQPLYFFP